MTRRARILAVAALLLAGAILALAFAAPLQAPGTPARATPLAPAGSPVVGTPTAPVVSGDVPDPEPWSSVRWQETPHAIASGADLIGIHGATAAGARIVAWGPASASGRNQFDAMAGVLVSDGGGPWRRAGIWDGVGPADTAELTGVAIGPGGMLAYGGTCCAVEERALWHSVDGSQWRRLPVVGDLDPRRSWLTDVLDTGAGWLAAGTSLDGERGALWHSLDGSTWSGVDVGLGDRTYRIADLELAADGMLAVGTVDAADGTHDGLVLRSVDGRRWERLAADEPALTDAETELHRIVAHAGGLWIAGNHGPSEDRRRCEEALRGSATTDPLPLPPMTALSCGWGSPHHWVSGDGEAWERLDPANEGGAHPIEYRVAVAGGPGILVLGEGSGPASPDTALFASPDGRGWTALGPEHPLLPTVALALAVDGGTIHALVEDWDGVSSTYRLWTGTAQP